MNYLITEEVLEAGIQLNLAVWEIKLKILNPEYSFNIIRNQIIEESRSQYTLENIKENKTIALYRQFYWKFLKIDPTKIRPASEALIRRILNNKSIPKISPMVDAYNWASIKTHIPMGAYDLEKISVPFQIRFSYEDEPFHPLGKPQPKILQKKVLVNAEKSKIICQYPYKDANFSCVTTDTTHIMLVAYGAPEIGQEQLMQALSLTKIHLEWLANQNAIEFFGEKFQYFTNHQ